MANPQDEEWEIKAPAFNVTKVASGLGVLVSGLLAVLPTALKEDPAVVIAAIAAATAVVLGIFALVAVDVIARQRAQEAKRRWPAEEEKASAKDRLAVGLEVRKLVINVADKDGDAGKAITGAREAS